MVDFPSGVAATDPTFLLGANATDPAKAAITATGRSIIAAATPRAAREVTGSADRRVAKATYPRETIVFLGDSWSGRTLGRPLSESVSGNVPGPGSIGVTGWFGWGNMMLMGRFRCIGDYGVAGDNLAGMLNRAQNGFTDSVDYVPALARPSLGVLLPDWLFIFGGINDVTANATGSAMFTAWQAIYNYGASIGVKMATATIPLCAPSGVPWTPSQRRAATEFNASLRLFCASVGIPCADFHSVLTDPSTLQLTVAYTGDSLHLNAAGAFIAGIEFSRVMGSPGQPWRSALPQVASLTHLNVNPRMIGSNARNTRGWRNFADTTDDDGPDGTWLSSNGTLGGSTMLISKVARADGSGDKTRLTYVGGTGTVNARAQLAQEIREISWSSGAAGINVNSGSVGALYTYRVVTATGRAAGTPVDYLVLGYNGTFSVGADPTAGWSTTLGAIVTDGTVTMRVVHAVIPGTTVVMARCVYSNNVQTVVGNGHIDLYVDCKDSGGVTLARLIGLYHDASSAIPPPGAARVAGMIETPAFRVPVGTTRYTVYVYVWISDASQGVVDFDSLEVEIATPALSVP